MTRRLLVALMLALAQGVGAATVECVRAQQRPQSNLVDVYYDLVDYEGGLFDIALSIAGGGDQPQLDSLTGDVGVDLTAGRNKHIVWDAGADWPNRVQSNFVATVTATPSMGMVWIPTGSNVGSDEAYGAYELHVIGFFMDEAEIPYRRWKVVYDWAVKHGYAFDHPGESKGDNHPVQSVSWYDCAKWCNARSEMGNLEPVYRVGGEVYRAGTATPYADTSHRGYRLPTSEEWEYAARGGKFDKNFPWGNIINREWANYYNSGTWYPEFEFSPSAGYDARYKSGAYPYTAPVGSFKPNDYGLYDMIGNVREWTGMTADTACIRGGSWGSNGKVCCIGNARGTIADPSSSNYSTGFRTILRAERWEDMP